MYFTSGSDRAFEQLMQTRPGADHFDSGEAGAPEDCGTCRFYRPHWKYQFCVYEECPYQPGKLTALDGAVKFQVKGVDDEMAVFRVEKNRGYTVMSNHHLRNKDLSLKAKGLLSQMLSLPEDWDFTLKGLSLINREQIDAIRAAVRELEQAGYIVRSRERDSQGRLRGADYIIYEQPQPVPDSPTLENPTLDNPTQEKPTQEKPTQSNKDRLSKEKSITDGSNTDSIPILSPPSPLGEEAAAPPERKGTGAKSQSAVEIYREIIKDNIEYEHLCQYAKGIDRDMLDEIVDLLVETVCSARKTIRIAGDDYPAELVKSKLMKLNSSHIEFVFDCISKNTTEIQMLAQPLEVGVVFPECKAALAVLAEPALFPLHNRIATVRADTSNFVLHQHICFLHDLGGVHQRGDHIFDFGHKFVRLHLAALDAQQFRFPVGGHIRRLDFFGHHGDKGLTLIGRQQCLGLFIALALQKALCHQLFDGSSAGGRGADALTIDALRHGFRAGSLHRVQERIFGKVVRW